MFNKLKKLIKKILGKPTEDREITLKEWLIQCGAVIGEDVELIECKCNFRDATCLEIGNHVTCSYVHFLTHDASLKRFSGNDCHKIGRIVIGNNVFIGIHTIILPNVHIGNNVVIGAGSVVTKDIPDNSVAVGNPARVVDTCEHYVEKHRLNMQNNPSLVYTNVNRAGMSFEERAAFNKEIDKKTVYFVDKSQKKEE